MDEHAGTGMPMPGGEGVTPPTPMPRAVVCPYCGAISTNVSRCERCAGRFDPLSRQATQNAMGPWYVLDEQAPTRPGCSYETLRGLVERGVVRRDSVVRGPTTRQFWMLATRVPGVAHLLGVCHSCQREARADAYACAGCGAVFEVDRDRQHLGVGPVRPLAGQASTDEVVAALGGAYATVPESAARAPARPTRDAAASERLARRRAEMLRRRQRTVAVSIGVVALAAVVTTAVVVARAVREPGPAGRASP